MAWWSCCLQTFVLKIFQKINLEGWAQSIFFTQCWLDWNRWYLSLNLGGPLVCGFIVSLRQLFGYLCYKWSIGHREQPRMIVHCYFSFIGCLIAAMRLFTGILINTEEIWGCDDTCRCTRESKKWYHIHQVVGNLMFGWVHLDTHHVHALLPKFEWWWLSSLESFLGHFKFKHRSSNLRKDHQEATNPTSSCLFSPCSFKMRGLETSELLVEAERLGMTGDYRCQFHMPKDPKVSVRTG